MPCPINIGKEIGRARVTVLTATARLQAARVVLMRRKGDCAVYWSPADRAWIQIHPLPMGKIFMRVVESSDCPCG